MITLDRLVNVVGSYGVRLRWSSVPRSTELRNVVIHEAACDRPVVGDVLLAIGAGSLGEAMQWAASAHAVVVFMRDTDEPMTFDGRAAEAIRSTGTNKICHLKYRDNQSYLSGHGNWSRPDRFHSGVAPLCLE